MGKEKTSNDVQIEVLAAVCELLDINPTRCSEVSPSTRLERDAEGGGVELGLDFGNKVHLLMILDDRFDAHCPDNLLDNVQTVGDVIGAMEDFLAGNICQTPISAC
jgi:acyl carrier protein